MKIYVKILAYIQVMIYICTEQQKQYKQIRHFEKVNNHNTKQNEDNRNSTLFFR